MLDKGDAWISDIVGALIDPIIVYPGGWGDDIPEWIRTNMPLARLAENMKALSENRPVTGTDLEACFYLSTTSLTIPIHEPWVKIYQYVFTKSAREWMKAEVPAELATESLTDYEMEQLKGLKDFIYRSRAEHRKRVRKEEFNQKTGEMEVVKAGKKKRPEKPLMDKFSF